MRIHQMKLIDRHLGWTVCTILQFIEKALQLFKPLKFKLNQPKNILITKYFGMGSILLAQPMVEAIRKKYPRAKIFFLTFGANHNFCQLIKAGDENLGLKTENFIIFCWDVIKNILYLREKKIDICIDLEFFSKFSTIISYLSGAKKRVGFYLDTLWRRNLLTHPVYYNHYKHIRRIYLALAESLGCEIDNLEEPKIPCSPKVQEHIETLLQNYKTEEKTRYVVFNINANELCLERRWPAYNFVKLAEKLLADFPQYKLVFIGEKKDRSYVRRVIKKIKLKNNNLINLAGKLDLEKLFALLKKSKLFITNDSGPLHFASALEVQTISFFGPETPLLYGPRGTKNIVFYKGFYCSPCLSVYNVKTSNCQGNNRCLQEIKVEEVYPKVKEILTS